MRYKGGHYIVACTPTCDHGRDLDPSIFRPSPLDRTENLVLTLDSPALTTPIDEVDSVGVDLLRVDLTAPNPLIVSKLPDLTA